MQGRKELQAKLLYQVMLEDLVPQDHFYRLLGRTLDLQFLYGATAAYYGKEGQESIDPVVFFKICLVGYLNNINSDRALLRYCSDSLAIRWFLRYDIDEALPWHSTISRTRDLYGEEVFLTLFKQVLSMCIAKGMVKGKRQAIDSAFIKANASLDSLMEKEILEDGEYYAAELNANSEYKVSQARNKLVEGHHNWKAKEYEGQPGSPNKSGHSNKLDIQDQNGHLIRPRYLSNHTHYSPTDPDARISVKPGKARQLNYFGQLSVDDAHHVITGACADYADKRDSQCLQNIVSQTQSNLKENNIQMDQLLADAGYSSGEALAYLQTTNLDAWIPNFGQYKPLREGFLYNPTKNQYECRRGHQAILVFKGIKTDPKGYQKNQYRSSESDCKNCPLRMECCGKTTKYKKLDDSIHKPLYDAMHQKMESHKAYAKKMVKVRSKTVEPVLGTLINFTNMKRVNTRGISKAGKHVLMAALTYNLKKYLKFIVKKSTLQVQEISQIIQKTHIIAKTGLWELLGLTRLLIRHPDFVYVFD